MMIKARLVTIPPDILYVEVDGADAAAKWRDHAQARCPNALLLGHNGNSNEFYLIQEKVVGLIIGGEAPKNET